MPREGLEEAAARHMHRVPHARTQRAKSGRTPRLRGKSILIPLQKKHKGMGESFTFNWTFCCSRWTSGCLLCRGCAAVPWFHHTPGAAGSSLVFWDPQCPGAGLENQVPCKGGHCSTAGLALLLVPFQRDFPFPPCWNNMGAVLDLAMTVFQPETPSACHCSPLTPLELVS